MRGLPRRGGEALSHAAEMEADCEIPSLFTELLELTEYHDGRQEWKEVARWIKYEETVEEEGNR